MSYVGVTTIGIWQSLHRLSFPISDIVLKYYMRQRCERLHEKLEPSKLSFDVEI